MAELARFAKNFLASLISLVISSVILLKERKRRFALLKLCSAFKNCLDCASHLHFDTDKKSVKVNASSMTT